jgi:hypothetical protein
VSRPYHIAPSLKALFAEVNRLAPRRSKRSDGGVGDARHQKQKSDHNPDFSAGGVVRAIDVTHDPKGGSTATCSPGHCGPGVTRASTT